jgi:polyketide cyclase/dehydrase/lipid transport protein
VVAQGVSRGGTGRSGPARHQVHVEVEVTAFDAPRTIEFTGREKGEDFLNTFVLTPQAGATRIDRTLDFPKPDGIGGAFFPLVLSSFIKPATNKGMKMLKANLENGTS